MNNLYITYVFLLFFLFSCKGQKENEQENISKISIKPGIQKEKADENSIINFLDKKYQKNGFSIPDDINGNLYPSYNYYDKSIGSFSVNYIGKNDTTQYFWSVNNKKGFFSKYSSPEDGSIDSKNIEKLINEKDYYIFAVFLRSQYIKSDNQNEDFEIKDDAINSFYLYDNNKWIELGKIASNNIPKKDFQYYIKLIQEHYYKENKIPEKYQGNFSTSVDTEETMTGMANITYNFTIAENKILLEKNTYHEIINCEGIYYSFEENGILNIYYAGEDMDCISITPKFSIKVEKGKYYIKGVGGEGTINTWIEMELNKK